MLMIEDYYKKHRKYLKHLKDNTEFCWKNEIEISIPYTEREFHARTSDDILPSSLVGVNICEVFSLLIQLSSTGRTFKKSRKTLQKVDEISDLILNTMNFEDYGDYEDEIVELDDIDTNNESTQYERAKVILNQWIYENWAMYREDRPSKIDSKFITLFPFNSKIAIIWGVKEAVRVRNLLLQLLTEKGKDGVARITLLDELRKFLSKDNIDSVGVLGKILINAISEKINKLNLPSVQDLHIYLLKEVDSLKEPICKSHATQIRNDLLTILEMSETFNKETIINWFYRVLSFHLALYVLRLANILEKNMSELFLLSPNKRRDLDLIDCKTCDIKSDNLYKCKCTPKIYPKIDDDPVVHKKTAYIEKYKEDEKIVLKLAPYLIVFNHIRTCMSRYYKKEAFFSFNDFYESYERDQDFRNFVEIYFGLCISRYLELQKITVERKKEYFNELYENEFKRGSNIKRLYDVIMDHYSKQTKANDSRKHFFDFFRNMSYSGGNGFIQKRRGVGNYYTLSDTLIQIFVQISTINKSNIIVFDDFKGFLRNRGVVISFVEDPDSIENKGLKLALRKLGLFYEASDAKEAQFVYGLAMKQ
ncbi:MAG: hypothetical protein ACTSP3_01640 [Candidatus Heimdallarchaeaceae archaeon]